MQIQRASVAKSAPTPRGAPRRGETRSAADCAPRAAHRQYYIASTLSNGLFAWWPTPTCVLCTAFRCIRRLCCAPRDQLYLIFYRGSIPVEACAAGDAERGGGRRAWYRASGKVDERVARGIAANMRANQAAHVRRGMRRSDAASGGKRGGLNATERAGTTVERGETHTGGRRRCMLGRYVSSNGAMQPCAEQHGTAVE